MSYKLKSNEETTKAFDIEETSNVYLLRSNIMKTAQKLAKLQFIHKQLTGKNLDLFK